jgi:hypothetical protein
MQRASKYSRIFPDKNINYDSLLICAISSILISRLARARNSCARSGSSNKRSQCAIELHSRIIPLNRFIAPRCSSRWDSVSRLLNWIAGFCASKPNALSIREPPSSQIPEALLTSSTKCGKQCGLSDVAPDAVIHRAMRYTSPETIRSYQLGMADQVRSAADKTSERLYGKPAALHFRDSRTSKREDAEIAVRN